jgi:hypothetical protein
MRAALADKYKLNVFELPIDEVLYLVDELENLKKLSQGIPLDVDIDGEVPDHIKNVMAEHDKNNTNVLDKAAKYRKLAEQLGAKFIEKGKH